MPSRTSRTERAVPESATRRQEHDPGVAAARARAEQVASTRETSVRIGGTSVQFGTASWTDPTLVAPGVFYPERVKSAEARLRYYATRFSMVEADSPYYALPARHMTELWIERTPAEFVFDVKAFGWMTGHAADTARLPRDLRDALPSEVAEKKRLYPKEVPRELLDEAWRLFVDAMGPLHDSGKLGAIFLQYPSWVRPSPHAPRMLARARARLGDLPAAVEFRHGDWLAPSLRERTFALLRDHGMSYVVVDEPQGLASSVPPDVAVTTPELAVVRLHGRRAETWEKRGTPVLERFRYLYDEEQLTPWVPKIVEIAEEAEHVHVVFNNCYGNYGTTNALEMRALVASETD
jgi:uncharacterized protein YecE (DUF72 family)